MQRHMSTHEACRSSCSTHTAVVSSAARPTVVGTRPACTPARQLSQALHLEACQRPTPFCPPHAGRLSHSVECCGRHEPASARSGRAGGIPGAREPLDGHPDHPIFMLRRRQLGALRRASSMVGERCSPSARVGRSAGTLWTCLARLGASGAGLRCVESATPFEVILSAARPRAEDAQGA